ncbi:PQQ-like beta-propeller repeat protein [Nocardioides sp. TF02-7]|uniref:PQQ-like beta-propeller repeat protein n=1 Tax=Nocardioides sp. TF02-7 TaxID=2917724 RepID=UPI001F05809E|nr:PQQ-like beta-propeller repeat protein [Nocardioides sp. TF02-7]UMG94796.1 PQQ-like beta-propeller repeat protein [Nocardioides sp. TF02-7]
MTARGERGNPGYCRPSAAAGGLAVVADRSGLLGFDADTGARLWRRPGRGAAVHRVYATDPLVADVALGGVRAVRPVDPATGRLGPVLARPLPAIGASPAIADPVGDTVVGAFEDPAGGFAATYGSVLRGWDLGTGEQRWARVSTGDDYLGADARGAYLGRTVAGSEDGDGLGYWVMRLAAGDPEPRTPGLDRRTRAGRRPGRGTC